MERHTKWAAVASLAQFVSAVDGLSGILRLVCMIGMVDAILLSTARTVGGNAATGSCELARTLFCYEHVRIMPPRRRYIF
jgi:hypothetical protein